MRSRRGEFPDFDPFPFGQRSWIQGLVRHILLARPLVDFGWCFEEVRPDEAAGLADSFRFACLTRERLLAIVRAAAAADAIGATR